MSTAFVFPGQGSQKVGMGKDVYDNFDIAKNIFDLASKSLGFDIKELCFEGPEDRLKLTEIAQPAILTVSIATLKAFNRKPAVAAGHSLGEYSALVCAGAIAFEDAVKIVNLRGKFMQEAVPLGKGAMSAVIGLDREKVIECCKKASSSGIVEAANFNCPGQIVISGESAAVEEAGRLLKEAGAKRVLPLAVSAPFHSSLMKSAADKLKAVLDNIEIKDADIPVISNVTAVPVTEAAKIKDLLIKQVTGAVLWEDSIKNMMSSGTDTFIEIGCGKVLAGLIKKTDEHAKIYNIEDTSSIKEFDQ
ncbi:MAG: ACP S-malonyltransferase [Candidatus Saganbacteria bacterium]|nr:ACP S-malonyltransferase [Candidatus Saganbacteria bacterium]